MSKFEIGEWVWNFDPNTIFGSCDKLRSHGAGLYKLIRKISPALEEVMKVYEKGKSRLVGIDILKEIRGDNNMHVFPIDPPHSAVLEGDKIGEIPNLINKPTDTYFNPTTAISTDTGLVQYSMDKIKIKLFLKNQATLGHI